MREGVELVSCEKKRIYESSQRRRGEDSALRSIQSRRAGVGGEGFAQREAGETTGIWWAVETSRVREEAGKGPCASRPAAHAHPQRVLGWRARPRRPPLPGLRERTPGRKESEPDPLGSRSALGSAPLLHPALRRTPDGAAPAGDADRALGTPWENPQTLLRARREARVSPCPCADARQVTGEGGLYPSSGQRRPRSGPLTTGQSCSRARGRPELPLRRRPPAPCALTCSRARELPAPAAPPAATWLTRCPPRLPAVPPARRLRARAPQPRLYPRVWRAGGERRLQRLALRKRRPAHPPPPRSAPRLQTALAGPGKGTGISTGEGGDGRGEGGGSASPRA